MKHILTSLLFLIPTFDCFAIEIVMVPNVNRNMVNQSNRNKDIVVRAGDTIRFDNLLPSDRIIEVEGRAGLTSDNLCKDSELPAGKAHAVFAQTPLPKVLYPGKELSGPYHTFPAGIIAMSPSSEDCHQLEIVDQQCPPNTTETENFNHGGSTYRLCQTSALSDPVCEKGKMLNSIWNNPGVQGVFLRVDWKEVNPSYNVFNWNSVNAAFAKAVKHGKTIMIGIRVGGNSAPDWIFDQGSDGSDKATRVLLKDWGSDEGDLPPASCGFNYIIASPSDENFKKHFLRVLDSMGQNIRADQRRFSVLSGVKVTGLGQQTLENRLPKRCNIAVRKDGDGINEGHLIDVELTQDLDHPVWIEAYNDLTISRRDRCICNPRALKDAGFTPNALYTFYNEVSDTLQRNFGYKQKTFMNVASGFPQISNNGRFIGDHLDHYVFDTTQAYDPNSETLHPRVLKAAEFNSPVSPNHLPEKNELTEKIVENARSAANFDNNVDATFGWGVENAALNLLPLDLEGGKCRQQSIIRKEKKSPFFGSPNFPIPSTTAIDATLKGCPNKLATEEGTAYQKLTGFQVKNTILGSADVDSALWNMTMNTNGVFIELYETDLWRVNIQTNQGSKKLQSPPSIKANIPANAADRTTNAQKAVGKTLRDWNNLLLLRAQELSDDHSRNKFLRYPHPTSFKIDIRKGTTERYFFNSGACDAYIHKGKDVVINRVRFR